MRRLLYAATISLSLLSCNKKETKSEPSAETLSINGLHDLSMDFSGKDILNLEVISSDLNQQPQVFLTTGKIPAGIGVHFDTQHGYPSFKSTLSFSLDSTVTPGTYPVQVIAGIEGTDKTKTYDFKLTVPAVNGFYFNNKFYAPQKVVINRLSDSHQLTIDFFTNEANRNMVSISFHKDANLHKAARYKLVNRIKAPDEVFLYTVLESTTLAPDSDDAYINFQLSEDSTRIVTSCPVFQSKIMGSGNRYVPVWINMNVATSR